MNIDLGNGQIYEVPKSIVPNEYQHLLLKAALSPYEEAVEHWNILKQLLKLDQLDLANIQGTLLAQLYDKLDIGANRLLPMVYKNLKALDDPLLQSIKSFYNYTWARNHYFYSVAKELEKTCVENGTPLIMLKGLAIAFYYADDPAIRVMEDIDVLVNPQKANKIVDTLSKKYIQVYQYKIKKFFKLYHSITFKIKMTEIDLHWSLSPFYSDWNLFTDNSSFTNVPNTNIKILNPTYSFLHTIIHGIQPNQVSSIRWITDCYIINQKHAIDWVKLLDLSKKIHCMDRLRIASEILPEYGVIIPEYISNSIVQDKFISNQFKFINKIYNQMEFMRVINLNPNKKRNKIFKVYDNLKLLYCYNRYKGGKISFLLSLPLNVINKFIKA